MRPGNRTDAQSLYFNYPRFDPPGKDRASGVAHRVVVVGAGPVGMTAALTLARLGIGCVLLDAKDSFNDGSRAICLARQSFQILESLGAVRPFLEKALPYLSGRSFYRGQQILEFSMPDTCDSKYRPMYNLQQQYTEAFLYQAIQRQPLIELRWCSKVTGVGQDDATVTLQVEDPWGGYTLRSAWVLAADGARSTVRSLRGLRLNGQNLEGRYVIADIRMERTGQGPLSRVERLALFHPRSRPGGTVLVHEQPDHIWRIDYQLHDGEDEQRALEEASVRTCVAGVLRDLEWPFPWDLEWWSIYSANTLALDDYRDGRIFFIGDSAHIVPIFGVRGLNNGLADAQNIAWKLAAVLHHYAPAELLESYTPERRGATLEAFAAAEKSARFMTPHSRGTALLRNAVLSLALHHSFAGQFANPRNMTPHAYTDSPLTTPDEDFWSGGPAPGEVVRDAQGEGESFLSERLGLHFTVLHFAEDGTREPFIAGLEEAVGHGAVRILSLHPSGGAARVLHAGPGNAYLIRPDQHVAARWREPTPKQIHRAMLRALGAGSDRCEVEAKHAASIGTVA